jgi:anti-sigma regulatory factor (Ser/Thr protein kinase)
MDALGEQLDLSADDRSALKLAVGEACNNAVQYGSLSGGLEDGPGEREPEQNIGIVCRLAPGIIEIDVLSESSGFLPAPGDYTMPTAESMAENGRGLALIELMMDSVQYLTEDGNHVVRMQKRISDTLMHQD